MTGIRRVKIGIWLLTLGLVFSGCTATQMRRLGDEYAKEANWQEAHQAYSEGLKHDPHNRALRQKSAEARTEVAKQHADRAKKMMEAGQVVIAVEEIKRAIALEPGKTEWHALAASALKRKEAVDALALANKMSRSERYDEAITEIERALEADPALPGGKEALEAVVKKRQAQRQMTDSLSLKSRKPITLNFQNTKIKEIFEVLEKLSGINILLDKDVRNDPITVYAKDVSFIEALNMIFATNGLFMKKISDETILVAPDTKPKQGQYQDLIMRTFYLSHASAKEMVNLLRTMLETRHLVPNPEFNTILMRDTPQKVALAERIVEANDKPQAEVMVNVELLEVKRTKGQKYGIHFNPAQVRGSVGNADSISVQDLDAVNNANIFLTLPSLALDFFKQESEAQVLASPRVRVLDHGVAKIKVGDRVPILLSSSNTNTGSTTAATTTTTSIEFKDVGIDMTIEPSVHLDGDMTLKVNISVTSLGDLVDLGNGQRQFQFGNRSTETLLNVRDGETVVISGLLRDDDRETVTKIPGLGDIPYLGRLFSRTDKGKGKTDVMISITPQIIRGKEVPPKSLQSFWSGTETAYSSQPLFDDLSAIDPDFPFPPGLPGEPPLPPMPGRPRPPADAPPPAPGPPPVVTFQPAEVTIAPEGEVTVAIQVNGAQRLSSAHFLLGYDPAVLSVVRMTEGDFLKIDGAKTEFVSSSSPGGIDLDLKRSADERGMTGSGTLFNVVLKGVRPGNGKIQIRAASLLGPAGETINAALSQAIVTVK